MRPLAAIPTRASGGGEAGGDKVAFALLGQIFGLFGGVAQGSVATCDQTLDQGGWNGEGGWALGGIEHAEAAAGTGADVEEAAALGDAIGDGVDGAGDGGQLRLHCRGDRRVLPMDESEHLQGGELIDVGGARVASFGGEGREIGHIT